MTPPLLDLSPLVQVLIVGLLLALLAVAWVSARHPPRGRLQWCRRLTSLTLFLTFDLVLFGAFTRLTDSGLGCPDWPGCYGSASPLGAQAPISAAQAQLPSGPVTHTKAWIEMVHRYLATAVGALILGLALLAWPRRGASRSAAPTAWVLPLATLVWVCIQGAFGALTVTMKLFPAIVTLHLLGGVLLLALLVWQFERLQRVDGALAQVPLDGPTRAWLVLGCVVLVLQVALGGWVSTNYAVLACTDFPMCQQSWWPPMRFEEGFALWRPLGLNAQGDHIPFAALTAIHFVHRGFALLVLAVLAPLAWKLAAVDGLRTGAAWLASLLALQLATGLANVVLGWPLLAAVMHSAGAAALVGLLAWMLSRSAMIDARRTARWPVGEASA
ncbi:MAG: COX15/CtaA family protein [Burkholderiaceae bacterium]